MRIDDQVDVTVIGRRVGRGVILDTGDLIWVEVPRPAGDFYRFHASRSFFRPAGLAHWRIDMPSPTLHEFLPDDERALSA